MKRFLIERNIPKAGEMKISELRDAARKSNQVLQDLGPAIQWIESFVADDKLFCVYLAEDEALIHRHAEISGFPANRVIEVRRKIDPTTAALH